MKRETKATSEAEFKVRDLSLLLVLDPELKQTSDDTTADARVTLLATVNMENVKRLAPSKGKIATRENR